MMFLSHNTKTPTRTHATPLARHARRPRHRRTSALGFSLLELLYALGFFSIGLFGIVGLQVVTFRSSRRAHDLSIASNLSSSMLEEIRVLNLAAMATPSGTTYFDQYGAPSVGPNFYTVEWQATPSPDSTIFYDVTVNTRWMYSFEKDNVTDTWTGHNVRMQSRVLRAP